MYASSSTLPPHTLWERSTTPKLQEHEEKLCLDRFGVEVALMDNFCTFFCVNRTTDSGCVTIGFSFGVQRLLFLPVVFLFNKL